MIMVWDGAERRQPGDDERFIVGAEKRIFADLGIDAEDPRQIEELREDLRFARKLRRAADHGFLAFIGIVVMATAAALWAGISAHLKH